MDPKVQAFNRLHFAAISFDEARALTLHLIAIIGKEEGVDFDLYNACATGIVTCYARPFMGAKGLDRLGREFEEGFPSEEMHSTHTDILMCRNKIMAHRGVSQWASIAAGKKLTFATYKSHVTFEVSAEGKPKVTVSPSLPTVGKASWKLVVDLCDYQIARAKSGFESILVEWIKAGGRKRFKLGTYTVGEDFP
jgi:hypothetical protein